MVVGLYSPYVMEADTTRDPIRSIATEYAAEITPMSATGRPDFAAWMQITDEFADDLERQLRSGVDA